MIIKPTPGRVVHYHPSDRDPTPIFRGEPLAPHVARVISDREVNLLVIRADGVTYGRHNVPLIQEGEKRPTGGGYCEWMAYQTGQARKTEALCRSVEGGRMTIDAVYHTAAWDAVGDGAPRVESLKVLSICIAVAPNGFTIIGKSAPASAENFNADLGRKLAYEDAVRQEFNLRQKLHEASLSPPPRMSR